jgi:hypothetical protein
VAAEVGVAVLPDQVSFPINLSDSVRTRRVGVGTPVPEQEVPVGQEKSVVYAPVRVPAMDEIPFHVDEIGIVAAVGGKEGIASISVGRLVADQTGGAL